MTSLIFDDVTSEIIMQKVFPPQSVSCMREIFSFLSVCAKKRSVRERESEKEEEEMQNP